jgi:hypothetical protein
MGCGVEDHGHQRDGYSACYYGWESAMERVYQRLFQAAFPETPATDAFLAEVRAKARREGAHFVANRMLAAWDAGFIDDTAKNAADIARMILTSTEFMADAPEGDFDRSFADGVLEDIAAQLRKGGVHEQPISVIKSPITNRIYAGRSRAVKGMAPVCVNSLAISLTLQMAARRCALPGTYR